jgi:ribose/xylose/arabinose/galactoside ABC-type transport system permease subunit
MSSNPNHSNSATDPQTQKRGFLSGRFKLSTELILLFIIFGISTILSLTTKSFLSTYNITNIFRQTAIIGIIAIASTFVIISGGIDLSVGSIAGLSAMLAAVLMSSKYFGLSPFIAIPITILVGTLIGFYHGFMIYDLKIPPFIATLGSMFIIRGVVKMISQAQTISNLPTQFAQFARANILGIPWLVIIWILLILLAAFVLKKTQFGRNIFVLGSSNEVARLSGIRMRLNTYAVYIVAAFLCSIAGVLLTARLSSAIPTGGSGYELDGIAAAVIGGASLSGAMGSVFGTALGAILMTLITNAGIHLNVNSFVMEIVSGALLTIAVVIDQFRQRKSGKTFRVRSLHRVRK